ncbi:membrane protein, partial [Streptomyces sp. MMG1533]
MGITVTDPLGAAGWWRVGASAAARDAVRGIADRLVSAGLAVPDGARAGVAAGVRQV